MTDLLKGRVAGMAGGAAGWGLASAEKCVALGAKVVHHATRCP